MREVGLRALAALLVVSVMLLASIGPLAQLARAQQGEANASANVTLTSNVTNTSAGYGIIIALKMSVESIAALFKMWGVPSNSSLWAKLQEINNTIPELENLAKQGELSKARQQAAKLFRELGLLVAEAAKLYANRVQENVTVARLVAKLNQLAALERAVMASLVATLHHLEASLQWAERTGATCNNVTQKLEQLIASVNDMITIDKQLINKTITLRKAILVGNMSTEQAINETKKLETQVREFVRNTSSLLTKARIAIAEPHACKAVQSLHRMIEALKKKIANLTEEAQKLRKEGRVRAAQVLEKQVAVLKQVLERYEKMVNKTRAELPRIHDLGDVIEIIKIRHMMPKLVEPVLKKFHILPIIIVPIKDIDRGIAELKIVALELRAAQGLVPSNLSAQYKHALGNLTKLINILEEYKSGKVSKEEVIKAANETLTVLEEFKEALKQYREQLQGREAQQSTSATTQGHAKSTNNDTGTGTTTNTSRATSTTTPSHTGTTTTPSHTETTTPRTKGGSHGDSVIGLAGRGESGKGHSSESSTSTSTKSGNPVESVRNNMEQRKITILLHLVDKAEAIIEKILVSLGQAPAGSLGEKEARNLARSIVIAERLVDAATKLAKLEGNQTIVKQLASVKSMLEEAQKNLASGNISVAKNYIGKALNETKQIISDITASSDWIAMKIRMFLERVVAILEMILASLAPYTS